MRSFKVWIAVCTLAAFCGCGSLIVRQQKSDDLLQRAGFRWTSREVPGFGSIHAEHDLIDGAALEQAVRSAVAAETQVAAGLGIPDYEPDVSVFLVGSRDRMEALIGRRTNATGFHRSNALCLVWHRSGREGLTHELVHLVAMNHWGVPERWVNEALAVDLTGGWNGQDLHSTARSLADQQQLPSPAKLTGDFGGLPSAVSYPAAGSLIRFVREEFGDAAVEQLWRQGRAALESVTSWELESLEQRWRDRLEQADVLPTAYDWRDRTPD